MDCVWTKKRACIKMTNLTDYIQHITRIGYSTRTVCTLEKAFALWTKTFSSFFTYTILHTHREDEQQTRKRQANRNALDTEREDTSDEHTCCCWSEKIFQPKTTLTVMACVYTG